MAILERVRTRYASLPAYTTKREILLYISHIRRKTDSCRYAKEHSCIVLDRSASPRASTAKRHCTLVGYKGVAWRVGGL